MSSRAAFPCTAQAIAMQHCNGPGTAARRAVHAAWGTPDAVKVHLKVPLLGPVAGCKHGSKAWHINQMLCRPLVEQAKKAVQPGSFLQDGSDSLPPRAPGKQTECHWVQAYPVDGCLTAACFIHCRLCILVKLPAIVVEVSCPIVAPRSLMHL